MRNFVLTSEAMTAGHPDKLCDQISDAVVDACLASDPEGGVVAECALASGVAFLSIRHRRPLAFDPAALARRVIVEAGYREAEIAERMTVMLDMVADASLPGRRAPGASIASHMTTAFGYACDQTPQRMPAPIWAAHRMIDALERVRAEEALSWLSPDAQIQVAVRFEGRRPVALEGVAFTFAALTPPPATAELHALLRERIIPSALEGGELAATAQTRIVVSPMPGPGGSRAHAGLTGRKNASDAYGGYARQSSSALSGKDPSRIERVAAYAARQAAVAIVAASLAQECEAQLSFAPGDARPLSVELDTFGSGAAPDAELSARLRAAVDFEVGAMEERLRLWELPAAHGGRFYRDLAAGGQFGRSDLAAPWDAADHLLEKLG